MNSILQCLIATPNFISALISINPQQTNSKSHYKGKIATQLIELLNTYLIARSKRDIVSQSLDLSARKFLKTFGESFEPFSYIE